MDGEYWIIGGNAEFMDGDIVDWNHESYALLAIVQNILNKANINFESEDVGSIEYYIEKTYNKSLADLAKENGFNQDTIKVLNNKFDPREYAIQYFGWQAVRGENVETWTLNKNDAISIYNGLGDILESQGVDDDEDVSFSIYIYSNNKSVELTYSQIEELTTGTPNLSVRQQITPDAYNKAMSQQAKQQDIQSQHPYYQTKSSPIGDHTLHGFKLWIESNSIMLVSPKSKEEFNVILNPTVDDVSRLSINIRGILTNDGDVYVWREDDMEHESLAKLLDIKSKVYFYIRNQPTDRHIYIRPVGNNINKMNNNPIIAKLTEVYPISYEGYSFF